MARACKVAGCDGSHEGHGWCRIHYRRWRKYGDPLAGGTSPGEAARYYRDVVLTYDGDDCLVWPYGKSDGYAVLAIPGRSKWLTKLICEDVYGAPPTSLHEGAHSCGNGNKACVARRHLSWKTHAANMGDSVIHGTSNRGERSGLSKLTEDDVRAIRKIGRRRNKAIAAEFDISVNYVSKILDRSRWGWLSDAT